MLTATTSASNPSFLWSPGGEITETITVSPTETTEYTVTVTDGETTCSASASGTVTIDPLVSVESVTICEGDSVTLTAVTSAANATFLWSPGGETTESITVSPTETTEYTVTVTDVDTTCVNSASGTVTVNPPLQASVESTTICEGDMATLTATTTAANPIFLWSPGGETTESITVAPTETTEYTVMVSDEGTTCEATAMATVTVNPAPILSVDPATICAGDSATLTALTSAANPSYLWSPGGETTESIMVNPTETTEYTVTVTDGETSCTATTTVLVTVNPLPEVAVDSATVCPGDSTMLTATTSAANPTFLWSPGGETTATIAVNPSETTEYTVTVTDEDTGCMNSASGTVTVRTAEEFANPEPVVINDNAAGSPYPSTINVSGLTSTVCRVTVTLSQLSHSFPDDIDLVLVGPNGEGVLLISDVGGGNDLNGATLTFDQSASDSLPDSGVIVSGSYRPTNVGSKEDGNPDVFPAPAPVASFGTNLDVFQGIDPNGDWSLYVVDDQLVDDGLIAGGWTLAITTLAPFTDLSVTQEGSPDPVAVGGDLTFTVNISNTGLAPALNVRLIDLLPDGAAFASASLPDGSCMEADGVVECAIDSLAPGMTATATIVVVPGTVGTATNEVSVTSDTFEFDLDNNASSLVVTVLEPPAITIPPASQIVCAGDATTFEVTATGSEPLSYQWFLDEAPIDGATSNVLSIPSAQSSDAGTYSVAVENAVGMAASDPATLTVNPLPTISAEGMTICVGESATLTAVTDAADPSFLWSPTEETTPSITVMPEVTTEYVVAVIDGATGCSNSVAVTVVVNQLTTATALDDVEDACPGEPVSFSTTIEGTGPFTIVWRKGDVVLDETSDTLTLESVTPDDAGTYRVEVTGSCNTVESSATLTVLDAVPALLTITLLEGEVIICWPVSCADYVLESTPSLTEPIIWEPVEAEVETTEETHCVTQPAMTGARFYRLRRL